MRERKDFMKVCLTAAGREHAGAGETVRIVTGRMHYLFVGGEAVEVLRRGEWPQLLAEQDAEGRPLFEEVQSAPAVESEKSEGV